MRQIWIEIPEDSVEEVYQVIESFPVEHTVQIAAHDGEGENGRKIVVTNLPNQEVSQIISRLETVEGVQVILYPQDVYPLSPEKKGISEQITHVTHRSPLEVWLNGLQSIGSWKGFLAYTVAASIVVWTALYTNTIYLIVAAMLIAPFAGPAMNLAIATATGDPKLVKRNLARYFISLALMILITGLLSRLAGQTSSTNMMVDISEISTFSVLLPLVAGAVGALNLSQSSNNSLVPGTVVGTLVAASLAPPAGVIGMSMALGRWDMAMNGGFILLQQLFAINAAGGIVFRLFGLKPGSTHFSRGQGRLFYASLGISLAALAGLLGWQFWSSPVLQRSTRAQRAGETVRQVIRAYPHAELVETRARFPRPSAERQNVFLAEVYVTRSPGSDLPAEEIQKELAGQIQKRLLANFNIQPLVSVTVLDLPGP